MKTPINGETLFEEFVEQIDWNQEAVPVQNSYSPKKSSQWTLTTLRNRVSILKTAMSGAEKHQRTRPGPTLNYTFPLHSRKFTCQREQIKQVAM